MRTAERSKAIPFGPDDLKRLREASDFFYSLYEVLRNGGGVPIGDAALAAIMKPAASNLLRFVEEIEDRLGDEFIEEDVRSSEANRLGGTFDQQ